MKKNTIAIIPARRGSKGVAFKNKKLLAGKPLIEYTIEAALFSNLVDIFISSDDDDILKIAQSYGLDIGYVRPSNISLDTTSMEEVVIDAFNYLNKGNSNQYKFGMILQPTSPFRTEIDIKQALKLKISMPDKDLIGVSPMLHHPAECIVEDSSNSFKFKKNWSYLVEPFSAKRRQDYLGQYWFINGAMYCFDIEKFLTNKNFNWKESEIFKMSIENSIDIDSDFDFQIADALMRLTLEK